MEKDCSRLFYDKYFNLKVRNIEVILKDGKIIKGTIAGFFRGDRAFHEPYVTKWHIVDENDEMAISAGTFVFMKGQAIEQDKIKQVKFCADGTVMNFINNRNDDKN